MPLLLSWGEYLWERCWRKSSIAPDLDDGLRNGRIRDVLLDSGAKLCGTTISSAHHLPFARNAFDLVIIDEASQCDVFSAVPLLWRAKRVLVIGDDKQLSPVYGMEVDLDDRLSETIPPSLRYTRNSLFSRCAHIQRAILLTDHHRSRPEIIALSNSLFYADRLRAKRRAKRGAVQWFCVSDTAQQEAEARWIVSLINKYRLRWQKNDFSVGVVTPFRSQVERLQLLLPDVRIDTAHRFQGEECDVMIVSLCVSASLSERQWSFVEAPELLNVAITRAKERLVIVGDQASCRQRGGMLARFASLVGNSSNSD